MNDIAAVAEYPTPVGRQSAHRVEVGAAREDRRLHVSVVAALRQAGHER
jgi:hypothetical protein